MVRAKTVNAFRRLSFLIMVTYKVYTDVHIDIYYNDIKIGHIEVFNFQKKYIIEIDYFRWRVEFKDKQRIPFLINSCLKSRKFLDEYLKKHDKANKEFFERMKIKNRNNYKILE